MPLQAGPLHEGPIRLLCWQEGVSIVEQEGIEGLSLDAVSQRTTASFKQAEKVEPSVFLVAFNDSLCLIEPNEP